MARPRKLPSLPCNIFQLGDGTYQAWVVVGKKPDDTDDRRPRKGKTPEIVEAKVRKLLAEIADNDGEAPAAGRKPTVEQWFTTWLTTIAPYGERALAESTLDDYWSRCRKWLFPNCGHLRVNELKIEHLDKLYALMYEARLAETSVLKTHAMIRRGLSLAQQRDLVKRNVAAIRDNPGSTKGKKRKPLTEVQALRFLDEVEQHPNGLRWRLALAIGPRQGEVLGLRWAFVDFVHGYVAIDWQIQRRKYRHGCADPVACARERCRTDPCPPTWVHGCRNAETCKGKPAYCPKRKPADKCRLHRAECPKPCRAGCRGHARYCASPIGGGMVFVRPKALKAAMDDEVTSEPVMVPPSLMAALAEHKVRQEAMAAALGGKWVSLDLVFCQDNGRPIDGNADRMELREILTAAGLPLMGTHAASRGTAATLMDFFGEDIVEIQRVLRQKDIRVTRGYIGNTGAGTASAAKTMEERLFNRQPGTDLGTPRQHLARRRSTRRRRP